MLRTAPQLQTTFWDETTILDKGTNVEDNLPRCLNRLVVSELRLGN